MVEKLNVLLQYYGISPWEIEVLYGLLNSHFSVTQDEIDSNDVNFVSYINIDIPLSFNEAFFQWFDFRRWEKVKAIFKEMKRRRGKGNALKIKINFIGTLKIVFIINADDKQWFNNAVEKIDFVLELLPYHLDPKKLPANVSEINYAFDTKLNRWQLDIAFAENKKYQFTNDSTWRYLS